MIADYKATYPGSTLYAQSGYRSNSTQVYLYNRQIGRQGGNVYKAGTISAVPGTSEHELGLAVDLTFDGSLVQSFGSTRQGKWLAAHCMEYGFILRYPADKERIVGIIYEPWHFRYVGLDVANDMKSLGVTTLEEYYGLYLTADQINPYLPYLK
jgi:D-alanyl-D-alanine carboxypeptidase